MPIILTQFNFAPSKIVRKLKMKRLYLVLFFLGIIISLSAQEKSDSIKTIPFEWNFNKYRFGGYGEILYQHMDYGPNRNLDPKGSPSDNRGYISVPRAVFSFDYKFRKDIILSSEIEIEYGGTGSAMELEYDEAGEYEMEVEKGGEIELEQLHITKMFLDGKVNLRAGHMIVPVGLTNAHHEPIFFLGTTRPEGEMAMLPCTWHETGISVLGYLKNFKYELMMVNGLDPNGFSTPNWVGSGRQRLFEQSVMTNPAFAARLEYTPVKGLRLGTSGYYASKTSGNSSKPQHMKGLDGRVYVFSADGQYVNHGVTARANFIYGNLSDSKAISQVNRTIFRKTTYPCSEVAEGAMTYSAEVGFNVFQFSNIKERLIPFVRYDYYDTMYQVEEGVTRKPRYERGNWSVGVNYFILPSLVVKADYSSRTIDPSSSVDYNKEHTFGLALSYTGWFSQK